MKGKLMVLSVMVAALPVCGGGVNEELNELLGLRFAAAVVPATEGRIAEVDPFWNARSFGMLYDPEQSFAVEKGVLEEALGKAQIEHWTFCQHAPWTPGPRHDWLVLDAWGQPFLALRLTEDQPHLVIAKQVTRFDGRSATLGKAQDRYFRCEVVSAGFWKAVSELVEAEERKRFFPQSLDPEVNEVASEVEAAEMEDVFADDGLTGDPADRAEMMMNREEWKEAEDLLERLLDTGRGHLRKSSQFGPLWFKKGYCELKQEKWKEALTSFETCHRKCPSKKDDVNPYHREALRCWGDAAAGARDLALAVRMYRKYMDECDGTTEGQ